MNEFRLCARAIKNTLENIQKIFYSWIILLSYLIIHAFYYISLYIEIKTYKIYICNKFIIFIIFDRIDKYALKIICIRFLLFKNSAYK